MESSIYLLTEWKSGGHLKADSMFQIKKGACSVVEDIALHLERESGHVPRCAAFFAFVNVWKHCWQTLV